MPFASTCIAQVHAAIDTSPDDAPVGQLRPIAGTHDPGITCAHVEFAVGIAAERKLFFEAIHKDASQFLLSKGCEE